MDNNVLRFDENKDGRDFIVGDLHGCIDMLEKLCAHVKFAPDNGDRLFCTGDLVDRGPDSLRTLGIIKYPWCHSVIGNHEQFILNRASDEPAIVYMSEIDHNRNGGMWLTKMALDAGVSVREIAEILIEDHISQMPHIIVVGKGKARFNIVHADLYRSRGLMSDWDIDNWAFTPEEISNMTWGRAIIKNVMGSENYRPMQHDLSRTYVGHTPVPVVCVHESQVYIDTGAFAAKPERPERGLTIVDHGAQKYWTYLPVTDNIVSYTVPPF